ncbi:hypothetical protein Q1695_015438 [Nippostrongylus brasiliensis]|nr:hypothetical protein Q1695_015438 [Nippostrongylus brasiliensis]
MEELFLDSPSCFTCGDDHIAVGFVDGIVQLASYDLQKKAFKTHWKFKTNASLRGLTFSRDQTELFAITRNKGLSCFDVETGRRKRCIVKAHDERPTSISLLQPTASKFQQFATGDESGEVRTWDLRADSPKICSWKEQEADVNALKIDNRHNLLSASSDGTLAAYEVRKRKLRMKSELMHSELVSLCVTDKYVYAGGRDGYLEVFVHGDYGNILERIETGFDMGVDDLVELRKGLLLSCSGSSDKLKLINVMPTKKLGSAGTHGEGDGIDQVMVSPDRSTLISMSSFANSIKFWPLEDMLAEVPVLRVVDIKKRKPVVKEGFFDDLMEKKKAKKRRAEDMDEECENGLGDDAEEVPDSDNDNDEDEG